MVQIQNDPTDYQDSDSDGVLDYIETVIDMTDANDDTSFLDTGMGGTPNYVEIVLFVNQGLLTTDQNNLSNDNQDTDDDGVSDYQELLSGSDPLVNSNPRPVSSSNRRGGSSRIFVYKDPEAINYSGFGTYDPSKCRYNEVTRSTDNPFGGEVCPADLIITNNMKQGDRNGRYGSYNRSIVTQVDRLQSHINRLLVDQYGTEASGPIDGNYGILTKEGVKRLQSRLNDLL